MKTTIITLVLLSLATYGFGQHSSDSAARSALLTNFVNSITNLRLDTLYGKINTLYSKNYKVRAKTLQSLVEKCSVFYEQHFPETKFDLEILVLSQEDYHKLAIPNPPPYGMPAAVAPVDKMFIAADKKAVGKLFGHSETLPDSVISEFDNTALHELGHIFLFRHQSTDTQKKWANEFLASYFAICYLEQNRNGPGMPQIDQSDFKPNYKTLQDFERLYFQVGAQNYGWYQGKFQQLGYKLYPTFKIELIKHFIDNYSSNGKKVDPLILLRQLAPQTINQWLEEMK